jgi:DNA-binding response OmpR family regulator
MQKIIVADDEIRFRKVISEFLKKQGYEILEASNGQEALTIYYENPDVSLLILDVMMPQINGLDLCSIIKKESNIPIIILTAKSEEEDELDAFNSGANDYISKPFSLTILLARVKNLLRNDLKTKNIVEELLNYKNLTINKTAHTIQVNNKFIELTQKEFEMLLYLLNNKGKVISREQILNKIWEYDFIGDERTVDTHIKNIRVKLTDDCNIIKTIRGYGYKIEEE